MIWYLLYPFRGTTDPPILSPSHPLRKSFHHHGISVARHWLSYILGSIALAVLLCYPAFFLYENPTTGFSKLPYHVWTSARRFTGDQNVHADVDIRQIWIHGSYMKALDKHVFEKALKIQRAVIGDQINCDYAYPHQDLVDQAKRSPPQLPGNWAFHSPLSYWNCSGDAIKRDADILKTINDHAHKKTPLNFTLRPTSVFAGKSFDKTKLKAADTLIITLFDKSNQTNGRVWDTKLSELAQDAGNNWALYPESGQVHSSRLYHFQFRPTSLRDDFIFMIAYASMFIYVVISLRKTRAVKSKFGLIVTVLVEILVSITASLTICGILKVDLSHVPREVYPFVVLVIGIENRFRLINAVLATPQAPIIDRLANALADVGHLSVAAAGQNLLVLHLCSRLMSTSVASFCTFAQVALLFDFIFHLTFFTAVLAVDVRRMDLQEFLDRAELSPKPVPRSRKSWFHAFYQGQLPYTSRIAGSALSISLLYFLNIHFDNESMFRIFLLSMKAWIPGFTNTTEQAGHYDPPPINQARTPIAWLRIQDYESAEEVIQFAKPGSHTLIARVYDPLTIVLHGSDRRAMNKETKSFLITSMQLLSDHLYPIVLALVSLVALTALLMQYLLWNDMPEDTVDDTAHQPSTISLKTLNRGLRLDVVKLVGGAKGHMIAVGLDCSIVIYTYDSALQDYSVNVLYGRSTHPPLWPVNNIAVDNSGNWAAIHIDNGAVAFWDFQERCISFILDIGLRDEKPVFFEFTTDPRNPRADPRLLVITPAALLLEIDVKDRKVVSSVRLPAARLSKVVVPSTMCIPSMVAFTGDRQIMIARKQDDTWLPEFLNVSQDQSEATEMIRNIVQVIGHRLIAVAKQKHVLLVDVTLRKTVYVFETPQIKPSSLRVIASQRKTCPHCQSPAIHSISLAYSQVEHDTCCLRTLSITGGEKNEHVEMCMAAKHDDCRRMSSGTETSATVEYPGLWESTGFEAIVGIRKRRRYDVLVSSATDKTSRLVSGFKVMTRRRRGKPDISGKSHNKNSKGQGDFDQWEAWALFTTGEFCVRILNTSDQPDAQTSTSDPDPQNGGELFVASPGPFARLGQRRVACGFGNTIKVITLGFGHFEADLDDVLTRRIGGPRKRKTISRPQGST